MWRFWEKRGFLFIFRRNELVTTKISYKHIDFDRDFLNIVIFKNIFVKNIFRNNNISKNKINQPKNIVKLVLFLSFKIQKLNYQRQLWMQIINAYILWWNGPAKPSKGAHAISPLCHTQKKSNHTHNVEIEIDLFPIAYKIHIYANIKYTLWENTVLGNAQYSSMHYISYVEPRKTKNKKM